ncbi:MAG: hypothetical protein RBS38_02275 [Bacteroidales bacterium]|jgi:hypothetical protein|nr:hypothetical protein [Bacteroidales bacterium]
MILLLLRTGGVIYSSYPENREKEVPPMCISYLVIMGESNVNRFSFTFKNPPPDQVSNPRNNMLWNGTELFIPVRDFEASNPHMYKDFLHQMQESRFPYISIRFIDFSTEKHTDSVSHLKYNVGITLAGVTRVYAIDCELVSCGNNSTIRGAEMLKLTDFNIPPPQKLNGLIKVRNEISVSFSLMINFTPENTFAVTR